MDKVLSTIIIFIGHPGGGKTTIAHKLAQHLVNARVIEVDTIKEVISGSVRGKNDNERELWFSEVNRQLKEGLKKYNYVIIDEGFFAQEYLDKIILGVESNPRLIVEITYDLSTHLLRDKYRNGDPIMVRKLFDLWHSVPDEKRIIPDIIFDNPTLSSDEIAEIICHKLREH